MTATTQIHHFVRFKVCQQCPPFENGDGIKMGGFTALAFFLRISLWLFVLGLGCSAKAGVLNLYVHPILGQETNNGRSSSQAKRTISAALSEVPETLVQDVEIHIAAGTYTTTGAIGMTPHFLYLDRSTSGPQGQFLITFSGKSEDFSSLASPGQVVFDFTSGHVLVWVYGGRYSFRNIQFGTRSYPYTQTAVEAIGYTSEVTLKDVRIRTTSQSAGSIYATNCAVINLGGTIEINEDLHDSNPGTNTFAGISADYNGMVKTIEENADISVGNGSVSVSYYGKVQLRSSKVRITSWGYQSNCLAANNVGQIDLAYSEITLKTTNASNTQIGPEDDGHIIADSAVINFVNPSNNRVTLQKASTLRGATLRVVGGGSGIIASYSGSRMAARLEGTWTTVNATTGSRLYLSASQLPRSITKSLSATVEFVNVNGLPVSFPLVEPYPSVLMPVIAAPLLGILPSQLSATTYYVSNQLGSDLNSGASQNSPLKTVQAVLARIPMLFNSQVRVKITPGCYLLDGAVFHRESRRSGYTMAVGVYFDGVKADFATPATDGEVIFCGNSVPVVRVTSGDWGFSRILIGDRRVPDQGALEVIGGKSRVTLDAMSLRSSNQSFTLSAINGAKITIYGSLLINADQEGLNDALHCGGIAAIDRANVYYAGGGSELRIGSGILFADRFGSIQLGFPQVYLQANSKDNALLTIYRSGRIDLHGSTFNISNAKATALIDYAYHGHTLAEGAHFKIEAASSPSLVRLSRGSVLNGQDFQIAGSAPFARFILYSNSVFYEEQLNWVKSVLTTGDSYVYLGLKDGTTPCPMLNQVMGDGRSNVSNRIGVNCPTTVLNPENDEDGDGQLNAAEELAGTDLNDPVSVFRIMATGSSQQGLWILVRSIPGCLYQVETSGRMNAEGWTATGELFQAAALQTLVQASTDRIFSQGFFRVKVVGNR